MHKHLEVAQPLNKTSGCTLAKCHHTSAFFIILHVAQHKLLVKTFYDNYQGFRTQAMAALTSRQPLQESSRQLSTCYTAQTCSLFIKCRFIVYRYSTSNQLGLFQHAYDMSLTLSSPQLPSHNLFVTLQDSCQQKESAINKLQRPGNCGESKGKSIQKPADSNKKHLCTETVNTNSLRQQMTKKKERATLDKVNKLKVTGMYTQAQGMQKSLSKKNKEIKNRKKKEEKEKWKGLTVHRNK